MRTTSYISAAALTAALFAAPQFANAQGLDINLGLGGDSGIGIDANVGGSEGLVDADVNVGGDDGLDVGAGVGGSDGSLVDVDVDAGDSDSGSDRNLVDVDIGGDADAERSPVDLDVLTRTGPNGGDLIDLRVGSTPTDGLTTDGAGGGTSTGTGLVTGGISIAALDEAARADALVELVNNPKLADIDLDAAIDDRRVSILAVADLLGPDELADIEAAVNLGGAGRDELLAALNGSIELGAILGDQGIDLSDVLAVEVAENGTTRVIVLEDTVDVALLGDNGDLATVGIDDVAEVDIDLLSDEELAEIDVSLLPQPSRTMAQLRLLGDNGDLADLSVDQLADIDLDVLSDDELAEIDLAPLPAELRTAVEARLLSEDGELADVSIGDLAAVNLDLTGGDTGNGGGDAGVGGDGNGDGDAGNGGEDGNSDVGNGSGNGSVDSSGAGSGDSAAIGTLPGAQATAGLRIAALDCGIGVLALAQGNAATPATIASAQSLELVSIDGCERSLMDPDAEMIRAALDNNPAISEVLDDAQIPLDQVIGATIQAGTLTVFVDRVES